MSKPAKISRRKLLGSAAGATAALPLLHEAVPHQAVHDQLARAQGADGHSGHSSGGAAVKHPNGAQRRTVGRVDPRVNGFDPTEILRDFDRGKVTREGGRTVRTFEIAAEDREIEVAPGVKFAAWTYNGRVPGPTLRATEGDLVRVKFVNGSSHPHTMHFHGIHTARHDGVPETGPGNIQPGEELHLRVRGAAVRDAPLPLPHQPAGRAHRQGPVRRVRDRPEAGPPGGRRAGDGDERLRHQLRQRERGLRREHRGVRLPRPADPGEARRAGADLPHEHHRVRPPELVPHSTRTSSTTTRPARSSSRATSPTRSSRARASAASASCAFPSPASTCSTPT